MCLCWFPGHQAAYCPKKFNSSFAPSSSKSVTRALAALSVGGEANDSVWYPDSGVASHMTHQDSKFYDKTPYTGSSSVLVGNGTLLPIKNTGNFNLKNTNRPTLCHMTVMFLN